MPIFLPVQLHVQELDPDLHYTGLLWHQYEATVTLNSKHIIYILKLDLVFGMIYSQRLFFSEKVILNPGTHNFLFTTFRNEKKMF